MLPEDFLKSIPNELTKLAGAVSAAMQLTDLAAGPAELKMGSVQYINGY